ncbi:MAG: sugar transferase [Bacteroidota bacterium]
MYRQLFKPLLDRMVALILVILFSPILLITAVSLAIANKGRVWFIQQRPGLSAKPFKVIKFRTMNDARDSTGNLLPDAERLTRLGKWIRRSSVDELPQLLNVILGDMSFVGPRPWLMQYVPLYTAWQFRRHEVRPGITGWAQVNGRNALSWDKRFEYDIYYVDHLSFTLDLKILWRTLWKVLRSEGISAEGEATMEPFTGTKQSSE